MLNRGICKYIKTNGTNQNSLISLKFHWWQPDPPHTPGKFQTARQTMFNTNRVTTLKKSKQKYVVNCCKTENLIRGD